MTRRKRKTKKFIQYYGEEYVEEDKRRKEKKVSEIVQPWWCGHCGRPLGEHPGGIALTCPTCKGRTPTPGFHKVPSEEQTKFLDEMKERAKKYEQQRRQAMRER